MARPLRVDVKDGWYHVTARGIERMAIFEDDRDHEHFLEPLEEMSNRYGVEVHVLYLNPIRTEGYGLGKSANKAEAMGWVEPDREQLKRRLKALRQFHLKTFEAGKFWVSRITATDARLPALFSANWRMGRRDPYDPGGKSIRQLIRQGGEYGRPSFLHKINRFLHYFLRNVVLKGR